jgi:CheY-like chemotaxis protein
LAASAKVQLLMEAGPAQIEVDPDRMQQVLTNLLSNAIKFSPAGAQVSVSIERLLDGVTISVKDNGRGIPKDKLESIFDRFQQVDASDARQKGGTGLGLAICRTIVMQHGGRIWAERNADRGSTFRMFLPSVTREADILRLGGNPAATMVSSTSVLVCDENPETRGALAESLRQNGYSVLEATSGDEAVAVAQQTQVQAILLDMSLPSLRGWETLHLLRDDLKTASIPVVVLSAFGALNDPEVEKAADAWLEQPLETGSMLAALSRVLQVERQPSRVLLVEDDADLAKVILATFERAGIQVHHAPSQRKAMELCVSSRPDLLILDIALPDGDGFGLVDWLRQQHEMRQLPLVIYSAQDLNEEERKKLQLGHTEFLTKARVQPQDVETLVLSMLRVPHGTSEVPLGWDGPSPSL